MTNEEESQLDTLEAKLCDEYMAWCRENGLEVISADEQILLKRLTQSQRAWLTAFILRWDTRMDAKS